MSAGSGARRRVGDRRAGSRTRSPPAAARRAARRSAACDVESLWICQCRLTVRSSCCCSRYMPRLRAPVSGCLVWVRPRLRKTPPSSGQALMPGSRSTGRRRRRGHDLLARRRPHLASAARCAAAPSLAERVPQPAEARAAAPGLSSSAIRSPISSSRSTPSAGAIRRCVPKTLIASGMRARDRVLEQQRRALLAHHPLDDPGHLEVRVDRRRDPGQVAVAFEGGEEALQIGEGHPRVFGIEPQPACSGRQSGKPSL